MYHAPVKGIKSPLQRPQPAPVYDPLAHAMGMQRVMDLVRELEALKAQYGDALETAKNAVETIQKGDKGDIGPRGYAGQKGDSIRGEKGDKGDKGDRGNDGKTPDPEAIKRAVLATLPFIEQKENETPTFDMSVLEKLIAEHPIIKKLHQNIGTIDNRTRAYVHGGGDTVGAGSGITVTTVNGTKVISATGATAVETPTGTVNGVNDDFTVTNEPLYIIVDGVSKFETLHYTYLAGALEITDGSPPVQYIRSVYSA